MDVYVITITLTFDTGSNCLSAPAKTIFLIAKHVHVPFVCIVQGRAEVIRCVLGYCLENDAWEDVYLTGPEDIAKLRASGVLMYHQVPYLTVNGKHYVQTSAILSMLGRKFNLYGANADESDM